MYELQTSNDEEETWKDLVFVLADLVWARLTNLQEKHGFDRNLQLTSRAYALTC
ncbi:hypothetical protein CPB83DRAFT_847526 [Crepidotus variabilis]|uniref:Uncharacterized protein n=1 Tax=Crepidotus variabilis TaxID=179855 RepID=A0A9P6EM01_9AGAR|nr:hypothetical protein CPB83DRAFT_847526 [Crepidotus variabilis]